MLSPPSNHRDWSPDLAVMPSAEIHGDSAHVQNIRNCTYLADDCYVPGWHDQTYDLSQLESVDYIVVPFQGLPMVAHTMLSFGFRDGQHLCLSVEIRRETGETYQFLNGILRQYELIYVLGEERDLVRLRTNYRHDDVYVYRLRVTPEQARTIFEDAMQRANRLTATPEYYNTFTNNCTTNTFAHIRRAAPEAVPAFDWRLMFPGYSDRLLYQAQLLDRAGSFEETRRQAWVSDRARQLAADRRFSEELRGQ